MSQVEYKPVACKGCGEEIVFEKMPDGRWLVSEFDSEVWEKGDQHRCPAYKPKPKQEQQDTSQKTSSWIGTNKQGQMFQAKVSEELERAQSSNSQIIEKMLTDIAHMLGDISRLQKEQNTLMQTWNEAFKEMYNMLDVIFKHFGLHEPKPLNAEEIEGLEDLKDQSQPENSESV